MPIDEATMMMVEANEVDFVALHRSERVDLEDATLLISPERNVATWNFAGEMRGETSGLEQLVEGVLTLFRERDVAPRFKLTPRSTPAGLEGRLKSHGFEAKVRLSSMVHSGPLLASTGAAVRVRTMRSDEDIVLFTDIQNRAFGAPRAWLPWFLKTNRRNVRRPDHDYYLAEVNGEPAGVSLLLSTPGGVGGVYAVATLEERRGHGVGRALMKQALYDSRRRGNSATCLNTLAGGPAERFFEKLGFETVFTGEYYEE